MSRSLASRKEESAVETCTRLASLRARATSMRVNCTLLKNQPTSTGCTKCGARENPDFLHPRVNPHESIGIIAAAIVRQIIARDTFFSLIVYLPRFLVSVVIILSVFDLGKRFRS